MADIFGFSGSGCAAGDDAAFCSISIPYGSKDAIAISESTGVHGVSGYGSTFFMRNTVDVPNYRTGYQGVSQMLNASHNSAGRWGSALTYADGYHAYLQFCKFHSNTPGTPSS
jgi:hypothetical protein